MLYSPNPEAEELGRDIIEDRRPDLADVRIAYLFSDKVQKEKGKVVLGKTTKADPKVQYFGEVDFVLVFPAELWVKMTDAQKLAVVDHELTHCRVETDEDDQPVYSVRPHDFEGFLDEIDRHGFWTRDLKNLGETARQRELFDVAETTKRGDGRDQHLDA